jgi:hypothetical protein
VFNRFVFPHFFLEMLLFRRKFVSSPILGRQTRIWARFCDLTHSTISRATSLLALHVTRPDQWYDISTVKCVGPVVILERLFDPLFWLAVEIQDGGPTESILDLQGELLPSELSDSCKVCVSQANKCVKISSILRKTSVRKVSWFFRWNVKFTAQSPHKCKIYLTYCGRINKVPNS